MKHKGKILVLATVGAVVGYSAWRGLGFFNKIRFKRQHEAIQSYVDTHYPGATIGDIVPVRRGWNCHVTYGTQNIIIHIISDDEDGFIFTPTDV